MRPVVVHTGNADCHGSQWKLDPTTLRLSLKGVLPYDHTLLEPQTGLLRYVLEQPYSRDMVCAMLGLQKIGVSGNGLVIATAQLPLNIDRKSPCRLDCYCA